MRLRASAPAPSRTPVAGLGLLVALLVAACAGTTASQSPAASGPPVGSAASPSDDSIAQPSPTSWPGTVVEAVLNLGTADAQIQAAGSDLQAAAGSQDLEKMWGAADGLVTLLGRLSTEVDRMRDYPAMAQVVSSWDAALPDMLAGAKKIRDSITAGDGAGVTAGFEQLAKGTTAYEATRRLMAPLVEDAIVMKRLLVK